MTKEKFKVNSVRTVKSPSNPAITTYYVWVDFQDLPSDISLDVNPRKPKMTTSVAKQLIQAVKDSNSDFDVNNRGIVITAKKVSFETSTRVLTLDLDDDRSQFGILDGGHTYTAIINYRDAAPSDIHKYVKLEIIVGNEIDVSALADARNTSISVSDIALFELDEKFDFIKAAIANESYANDVAYKDNDNKRIPISNLLKLLFAFNIKRYSDDSQAPVSAYSGKAVVFKDYKKEYSTDSNIYSMLAPQLPKLVDLYEIIQKEIGTKYQQFKRDEEGKKAKFGLVRGVEKRGTSTTDYKQDLMDYDVSTGFLMPIFGAFRALLKFNDTKTAINWEFDPIEVWHKTGVRLVQNTFDTDTNPQQTGKSKTLWQANYRIVDSVRKDLLLDKLMSEQGLK
ncbi:AIPR family protein [Lactiplantibacillus paraplantarum]|uniref:Abortive phage infection protein n=1 Tax=Lactiplantibacillus paraplantarum TaxID=60520 RepID=A0A4Q9XXT1_9LACO|nr:AIPR family protein [Lactiplantibacillus paraplantarum]TBX37184.1 abortive phage infection protein [Lactiplantibacillus paraplantarum]WEE35983.1 AIPR family protein [Lactiplantibacillus paraplantarum]